MVTYQQCFLNFNDINMKVIQTVNCQTTDNSQSICLKIRNLINANCEYVRINLKNFTESDIQRVDKLLNCIANEDENSKLKIVVDIPSTKIKYRLNVDTPDKIMCGENIIICEPQNLCSIDAKAKKAYIDKSFFGNINSINEGDVLYWGDGEGKFKIVEKRNDSLKIRAENDFFFFDNKSISKYYKKTKLDNKQIDYLRYIIEKFNINIIFLSFCESSNEVRYFKQLFPNVSICGKIETQLGIDNINKILEYSDGIMIARGDLLLNTSLGCFLNNQNYLANTTISRKKELFIATDVLMSLNEQDYPSRADLCDIELIASYLTTGIILKTTFYYNNRFSSVMKLINAINDE